MIKHFVLIFGLLAGTHLAQAKSDLDFDSIEITYLLSGDIQIHVFAQRQDETFSLISSVIDIEDSHIIYSWQGGEEEDNPVYGELVERTRVTLAERDFKKYIEYFSSNRARLIFSAPDEMDRAGEIMWIVELRKESYSIRIDTSNLSSDQTGRFDEFLRIVEDIFKKSGLKYVKDIEYK